MDPKVYHGTVGRDGQEGQSMYPRPVTGGRYQGLVGCPRNPRHYGTMGHPEVPEDILRQSYRQLWNIDKYCIKGRNIA